MPSHAVPAIDPVEQIGFVSHNPSSDCLLPSACSLMPGSSRLALFSVIGKARVEGVSPSDRRQDARDAIGFVSHNRLLADSCHCEERSDAAISALKIGFVWR
jgi:hypothetical protein